ncbi:MAG: hypothetical protein GF405_09905 [Candidatus Eisenbacteria bacterium]|nr:hypothetical protein [Candidatus Eisenbacteria bacterium]
MTSERLAARLVMVGARCGEDEIEGSRREVLRLVRDLGVGGLIIFGGRRETVGELIAEVRAASHGPLLVASDLERGLGWQVKGGTLLPCPMAIAASGDTSLAFEAGRVTGSEARDVGIDLVFAPVADLADRPDNPIVSNRSFGGDPHAVRRFVQAFIRGCHAGGAAATAKHFPGHGRTRTDSHIELPTVDAPEERLRGRDLVPFRGAIEAGVDAVMTAHVAYPALDASGGPAGFSRTVVTGLLRREFGFDGLVVTDALVMGGVTANGAEAARRALAAGSDVLLAPADARETVESVAGEIEEDPGTASQAERSVERIEALVRRVRSVTPPPVDGSELADRIAGAGATVLRGSVGPDIGSAADVAVVIAGERRRLPDAPELLTALPRAVRGHGILRLDERGEMMDKACEAARSAELTLVALYDEPAAWRGGHLPPDAVVGGVRSLLRVARNAVLVLCCPPFVLSELDADCPVICVWDTAPASERAAAGVLLGRSAPGTQPDVLPGDGA